jgi:hypothetical protein
MRWFWVVPVLLAVPLLTASSCPLTLDTGDGGVTDEDGGVTDDGGTPTLRDITFGSLAPGELTAATTIDGVTITPGAYQGAQLVQVQDSFGEGQDLQLQCGLITVTAPELHQSFSLVFNDDNGTLVVSFYDQNGQLLTDRPIDTRADGATLGITNVDSVYQRLIGQMASGSTRRIARLEISSCAGAVHEIVLQ